MTLGDEFAATKKIGCAGFWLADYFGLSPHALCILITQYHSPIDGFPLASYVLHQRLG